MERSQRRIAWICVGALAFGAYHIVLAPAERKVQYLNARSHDLYELGYRNKRMLARAAGLSAARERVALDVAYLSAERSDARTMLNVLNLLQKTSSRAGVTIAGIAPDGPSMPATTAGFTIVTLAMRGSYRNVLAVIADISRHRALLEVSSATLVAAADSEAREIDATVHATVYSKLDALMKEKQNAVSATQ